MESYVRRICVCGHRDYWHDDEGCIRATCEGKCKGFQDDDE